MNLITGFHAVEEKLKYLSENTSEKSENYEILVFKPGPRVKKIIAFAETLHINIKTSSEQELNKLVETLPELSRDHRGLVLIIKNQEQTKSLSLKDHLSLFSRKEKALVLVLDSITDPHNVGAIIRSADQFGVDLIILPESRSATDVSVLSRTSAGASAWVPIVVTPNLVRATQQLKEAGFWVYGADAKGNIVSSITFADKTCLVMGSEGRGIAHLLKETCDTIVSIPTSGRLDSLNVSVAAGILLHEIRR